jgi:hypothetical protein
MVSGG